MTLKDIDSSRLLFDIKSPDFVKNIKHKIKEFTEYKGDIPEKKLFQWIVLMYDIRSDMRSTTDYYLRKHESAEIVGMPKDKSRWKKPIEDMLVGKDSVVNELIVAYLWQFGLPEVLQLVAYQSLLSSETKRAVSFDGDRNTIKIIEETGDRINKLTRIILNSGDVDEITLARNALYARVEKEKLKLRPEDVVRFISEEGGLPDEFNPYGAGYMPEHSKFIGDEEPTDD